MDLAEGDYRWLDGIAADVQFNNLTVPMVLKHTNVLLMDDWGSFESEPEFRADSIAAIGLYTSDPLTETHVPVAMESREALADTFNRLQDVVSQATTKLWGRIAGWSRAEMIDAGALADPSIAKDLTHMAGPYEQSEWMEIDQRAPRFVPLLNDEYGRDALTELLGSLSLPSQQLNEYSMSQHNNKAKRTCSLIPYGILATGDYTASAGSIFPGDTALAPKQGKWRTSCGLLTQDEYNAAVRDFAPAACNDRFLNDFCVKYNSDHPEAQVLYQLAQQDSRTLRGCGAGLKRADIARLRAWA